MHVLVYAAMAFWIGLGVFLLIWNFILSAQMMNHRVPKQQPILGPRKFSFQGDPADYTAVGQGYRRKAIQAEIALLAYVPTLIIAISIACRV